MRYVYANVSVAIATGSAPNSAHHLSSYMALVPGLNIGVGLLLLIVIWAATLAATLALAAVPKAR